MPCGLSDLQLFSSAFLRHLIQLMCFNLAWLFQGVPRARGGSQIALSCKLLPEDIADVKENATFLGRIESSHISNNVHFHLVNHERSWHFVLSGSITGKNIL